MAPALPLLLCLLVTSLLAGCAGSEAAAEPVEDDPSQAGPAAHAGSGDSGAGAAQASPDALAGLQTTVCAGTVRAGVGVQGNLQMGVYCPFRDAARGDLSGYQAALVEVRWPDAMPTQTAFNLFLLSDACNFSSEGGSCNLDFAPYPNASFRYEVPLGLLRSDGDDGLRAYVSFDGPAVDQAVEIAVTLVPPGGVLPAGHSALPG